jgi:hypothetical protein
MTTLVASEDYSKPIRSAQSTANNYCPSISLLLYENGDAKAPLDNVKSNERDLLFRY